MTQLPLPLFVFNIYNARLPVTFFIIPVVILVTKVKADSAIYDSGNSILTSCTI